MHPRGSRDLGLRALLLKLPIAVSLCVRSGTPEAKAIRRPVMVRRQHPQPYASLPQTRGFVLRTLHTFPKSAVLIWLAGTGTVHQCTRQRNTVEGGRLWLTSGSLPCSSPGL